MFWESGIWSVEKWMWRLWKPCPPKRSKYSLTRKLNLESIDCMHFCLWVLVKEFFSTDAIEPKAHKWHKAYNGYIHPLWNYVTLGIVCSRIGYISMDSLLKRVNVILKKTCLVSSAMTLEFDMLKDRRIKIALIHVYHSFTL